MFIRDKMTALKYIDIVNDNIMPSETDMGIQDNFVFQQDNDSKHTARRTKPVFLSNHTGGASWPSNSPDMDPIENLWDELDRLIPQSRRRHMRDFE